MGGAVKKKNYSAEGIRGHTKPALSKFQRKKEEENSLEKWSAQRVKFGITQGE